MLGENLVYGFVEVLRRLGVASEGFFDHDAPRPVDFVGQSARSQLRDGLLVELGGRGQVVDARRPGDVSFQLGEPLVQCFEILAGG